MIEIFGEVVANGFTVGIVAGSIIFLSNWVLSSAMNIFNKITKEGE
jgi:hypothetical protein